MRIRFSTFPALYHPDKIKSFLTHEESFQYIKRLEAEAASIRRIQEYQARLFALVGTGIVAAFVSVGNVVARFAYDAFNKNPEVIWIWVAIIIGSVAACMACCMTTIYLLRSSAQGNGGQREYQQIENV